LFVAPNDVLFFAVLAPLAAYLLAGEMGVPAKWVGLGYLLVTFVVTVYMQSRQAVGIYVGGLCLMALLWRPALGIIIVIAGTFLVLVADWFTGKGLLNKLVYLFPRRYVWEAAWQMFLDRPWLGQGPGMFKDLYVEYLEKAGYIFTDVEDRRPMNWAHSLYLEQLAERGLCGFLVLFLMIGVFMKGLFAKIRRLDAFSRAMLACWSAYLAAGIAEASLLRLWVVTTLFLLLGITRWGEQ
jgi:O-antigen ligase